MHIHKNIDPRITDYTYQKAKEAFEQYLNKTTFNFAIYDHLNKGLKQFLLKQYVETDEGTEILASDVKYKLEDDETLHSVANVYHHVFHRYEAVKENGVNEELQKGNIAGIVHVGSFNKGNCKNYKTVEKEVSSRIFFIYRENDMFIKIPLVMNFKIDRNKQEDLVLKVIDKNKDFLFVPEGFQNDSSIMILGKHKALMQDRPIDQFSEFNKEIAMYVFFAKTCIYDEAKLQYIFFSDKDSLILDSYELKLKDAINYHIDRYWDIKL